RAQSAALLQYGALRFTAPKEVSRQHRKYQFENSTDWTGRHFRLCIIQRRDSGAHARMGSRTAELRNPCKCGRPRRSYDSALSAMAGYISKPRREADGHPREDTSGKTDDHA